jgi:diguanylate cyclase (GGDEF)-like protein/PAS domain S-box-containing protein
MSGHELGVPPTLKGGRAYARTIAVFLAVWVLGLGVLGATFALNEREDRIEKAPLSIARLRQQVATIPALPFETVDWHGSTPGWIRGRLDLERTRFRASAAELEQFLSEDQAARLDRAGTRYFGTIDRVLSLVAAGEIEPAGALISRADQHGGSMWQLRDELSDANRAVSQEAEGARVLVDAGVVIVVCLALLAFSIALHRATRSRRRAERLADANARLLELSRTDEERYRDLFENANEPIATIDLEWNLTAVNAAFSRLLGYTRAELIGTKLTDYLTDEGKKLSRFQLEQKLTRHERATTYEQTFVSKGGRDLVFEVSTRLIEENGVPVGVQGMCRDITSRKDAEDGLRRLVELTRYQAHHDALTGLPNRLHFHDEIERAIAAGKRRGPFAVALIDLDRFKEVNDSLGHRAGDVLLQKLATELKTVVRSPDTVARLGGDEFGVLLHGPSTAQTAWVHTVQRIKSALEQPLLIEGIPVNVEASIGIAIHPTHGDGVDALLQRADVAMYVAKSSGRGHAVYTPNEDSNDARKLALIGELRRALTERELTLHYQPVVDRRNYGSSHVEALLRWEHPTRGLISPADFLPLAERTGLIKPLTQYVLEEAVRQCKQWERGGRLLTVSVNLSTRNLSEPDLVDNVLHILSEWKLDPSRIILEITESAVIADPVGTRRVLARLNKHGIKVAIDDFGAGSTSLSHLAHLPIDELKIDRSFITGMTADTHDRAIVRSIINLSHDLGLDVVAEGVETREVLDDLRELGVDRVQGYYFARPLVADEVAAWFENETPDERSIRAA